MPARTYIPTLRLLAHQLSVYTSKYSATIQASMSPSQVAAFLAFISCLADLISELGAQPYGD